MAIRRKPRADHRTRGFFAAKLRAAMDRPRYPTRVEAERRFPHKVDIPIPTVGLGRRLTDMLAWCRESLDSAEWDQHVRKEREAGEVLVDLARFYFASAADAEAFRRRWL